MLNTIEMQSISMSFGQNAVLRGVDLKLTGGSITALLGANGAGKSTLIKILSGVYTGYQGELVIDGKSERINSTTDAVGLGIQTVHQRVSDAIVPGLTVAENLLFEKLAQNKISKSGSTKKLLPRAQSVAEGLGLRWDTKFLKKDVYELGIADQQLLLLARALVENPKLLILDEPTSALSLAEVESLIAVIDGMKKAGVAILYVSHRLSEIDRLADELVVLRDGKIRGEQTKPFQWPQALEHMLGKEISAKQSEVNAMRGEEIVLEARDLKLLNKSKPFDLKIKSGEVTGVIGLLGSGKTELAEYLFGSKKAAGQKMTLRGKAFEPKHPSDSIKRGVYLVPEDRSSMSMFPGWSITRTITLPFLKITSKGMVLQPKLERNRAQEVISRLGVVTSGPEQEVDSLSGGNQQKVVVGRWLQGEPTLLILDEPFRGVDIGARRVISQKARELAGKNAGVLVLTSEVDELLEVADRIVVLVDGVPRMDAYVDQTNQEEIVSKMSEVSEV